MTYFTDNPLERMMVQRPKPTKVEIHVYISKDHSCHGCKRYGQSCVKPCYRDLQVVPREVLRVCVL